MEGKNNDRFETHPTSQTLRWYLLANSQKFYVLELMAALILLALGLTEKPRALKANNLSVPVKVSVHSALGRGVRGGGGGKGKSYKIWLYKVWIKWIWIKFWFLDWGLESRQTLNFTWWPNICGRYWVIVSTSHAIVYWMYAHSYHRVSLIMLIGHHKEFLKLIFPALTLHQSKSVILM